MFFIKLKSFIRDYFTLTSRERKGALVLSGLIILQIIILIYLNYVTPPDKTILTTYRLELETFQKTTDSLQAIKSNSGLNKNEKKIVPKINKPFDPNQLTADEWIEFGLSQKQAQVILNYLAKGGRFRTKESVSKMYCITPQLYQKLEPWIKIPEENKIPFVNKTSYQKWEERSVPVLELNSADTIQLAQLPLVGAGRARMIFKYREKLGGFFSINQLLEVFTIDSVTFQTIKPYIRSDASLIRKINFNSDSLYHPYLNKKAAAAIIAYRKQHGNFIEINDLHKVTVLDEQMWSKVAPYAAFE